MRLNIRHAAWNGYTRQGSAITKRVHADIRPAVWNGDVYQRSTIVKRKLPDTFDGVREALEAEGIPMISAEVTMIPQNYVELTDEADIKALNKTLDLLDDDDDVQNVYHNWDE